MKPFLLKLLIFIVPVVIMAYLLDGVITTGMRKTQPGAVRVMDDLVEGGVNADVVVYGNSRALNHIDPAILTDSLNLSAYNLGVSGLNFIIVKCRHDLLMKYNRPPKLIILSVDYFILDKWKNLYDYKDFAPFINEPIVREATKHYVGFDFYDYHLPLVRYIGYKTEIKEAIKYAINKQPGTKGIYPHGYYPHDEAWNGEFDEAKRTMKKYIASIDTPTLMLFDNFVQDVQRQNIKLVFVYTPEYYEGQQFTENRAQIIDLFKSYSNKYTIPFLDYSNDTLCSNKRYFYNALHLNLTGATIFSRHLAHDVKELIH